MESLKLAKKIYYEIPKVWCYAESIEPALTTCGGQPQPICAPAVLPKVAWHPLGLAADLQEPGNGH